MSLLKNCEEQARLNPQRIVFADSMDDRVLQAVMQLQKHKLARAVLVGNPFVIRNFLQKQGVPLNMITIKDHLSKRIHEKNQEDYITLSRGKGREISEEEAFKITSCPLIASAFMVKRGEVDMGISGNLSSTGDVIRAGLRVLGTAEGTKTVSSLFYMLSPGDGRVLVFTDAGVIPEPTVTQLADIAIASAENMYKVTKETPRVALLSFSTNGSAKHPRVEHTQQALEEIKKRQPSLIVDGELQFDAAIVPEVAAQKSPNSPIKGRANVLVFPSLEAGNISYKVAQRLGGYTALGPFLQGFSMPWHDLSRGCSANDIYEMAIVGTVLSGKTHSNN